MGGDTACAQSLTNYEKRYSKGVGPRWLRKVPNGIEHAKLAIRAAQFMLRTRLLGLETDRGLVEPPG